MQRDILIASLQQIKVIAQEALKEVRDHVSRKKEATARSAVKSVSRDALPSHILRLRDTGFFKPAKTPNETHVKLQPIYPCDLNRVAVAPLRLRKRKQLRKASKLVGKRKQVAYGW